MNSLLTLRRLTRLFSLLLAAGLASCEGAPEYPEEPSITFKSIQRIRVDDRIGVRDSLVITVAFKDGDGDLGLDPNDTDPPYDNIAGNRYYNNYFVQPFILVGGRWEPLNFSFSYNGRFPRVKPDERKEPLRGDLNYSGIVFYRGTTPPGSQLRFEVQIVDRALHESNVVTTDPVTLP